MSAIVVRLTIILSLILSLFLLLLLLVIFSSSLFLLSYHWYCYSYHYHSCYYSYYHHSDYYSYYYHHYHSYCHIITAMLFTRLQTAPYELPVIACTYYIAGSVRTTWLECTTGNSLSFLSFLLSVCPHGPPGCALRPQRSPIRQYFSGPTIVLISRTSPPRLFR